MVQPPDLGENSEAQHESSGREDVVLSPGPHPAQAARIGITNLAPQADEREHLHIDAAAYIESCRCVAPVYRRAARAEICHPKPRRQIR